MRSLPMLILAVAALAASPAVSAQPAPDAKGRYTMTPVDGGFMRLDTETGGVALCTRKGEAWTCEPVDDKTAPGSDKAKLEAENQELKARVKQLEESQANSKPPADGGYQTEPPGGINKLPTEEEVDKALDYVERMFKKLRDRVQKFETPGDSSPKPDGKPDSGPKSGQGGSGAL